MAKEDGHFSLLFFVKIPQDSLMMALKILPVLASAQPLLRK